MAYATARHILVESEEECNSLKAEIEGGTPFEEIAAAKSQCPSGAQGGGGLPAAYVYDTDQAIGTDERGG